MLRLVTFVLMCLLSAAAAADEDAIRKALEPKLNGVKIEGVSPTPVAR